MASRTLILATAAALALTLAAIPARADWHGGWRGGDWHHEGGGWHEWHDRDWHDHDWHGGWGGWGPPAYAPYAYAPPPPVYYAPPPAYYAPPPTFSFGFGFP